jgi:hypothetical protein
LRYDLRSLVGFGGSFANLDVPCCIRSFGDVDVGPNRAILKTGADILSVAKAGMVNDREKEPYSRSTRRRFSFFSSLSNLRAPLTVSMLPPTQISNFRINLWDAHFDAQFAVIFINIDWRGELRRD